MNSLSLSSLGATAGLLAALALAPTAATAAAPADAQSCWVNVDTGESACFDASLDPIAQIEADTGTTVVAVPTGSMRVASARSAAVAADAETYLLATGWDEIGYAGASVSYFTTLPQVCDGYTHGFSTLHDWDQRFESLRSYNGCVSYVYDAINFSGTEFGPISASADLGAFKDRARSLWLE
ncbi:hypothetical protein GCM10027064_25260 [Microbacterium petrolearium]|jgi:hypothetical protein